MPERRADLRARTALTARILERGEPPRVCIVLDLSRGGAGLMAVTADPIPERFDLALPDADEAVPARLVWQRDGRAGVAFPGRRPGPPVIPDLPPRGRQA